MRADPVIRAPSHVSQAPPRPQACWPPPSWPAPPCLASAIAAAKAAPAATASQPPAAAAAPKKADAATRAAAERLDPLRKATFWAGEVQADPADATAGVKLAESLRTLTRFDEAAAAAERVLLLNPDNVDALLEDARACIGAGKSFYGVKALEHAQQVALETGAPPCCWASPTLR